MQFNKIDIKSTEDEEEPSPVPGIGIMVLVDGEVYASSDYHVDVDSFFRALAGETEWVEFIGGCHIKDCCGSGARAEISPNGWVWNDGRLCFKWSDVLGAARRVVKIIQRYPGPKTEIWCVRPGNMQFYQQQLSVLKQRVAGQNG